MSLKLDILSDRHYHLALSFIEYLLFPLPVILSKLQVSRTFVFSCSTLFSTKSNKFGG